MVKVRRMRAEGWQDGAVGRALVYGPKDLSVTPRPHKVAKKRNSQELFPDFHTWAMEYCLFIHAFRQNKSGLVRGSAGKGTLCLRPMA